MFYFMNLSGFEVPYGNRSGPKQGQRVQHASWMLRTWVDRYVEELLL